jgi:hypothetical protein
MGGSYETNEILPNRSEASGEGFLLFRRQDMAFSDAPKA